MRDWEDLEAMLNAGKISRRDFMSRAAALGISTALAGSMISRVAGAAEVPKKGGNLILGVNGAAASDSLTPDVVTATHLQVIVGQLYNTLTEVDVGRDLRSKPSVQPVLAESWESKPGAKEW